MERRHTSRGDNDRVGDQVTRFVLLLGPFVGLGVLILALRWTYGTDRHIPSRDPDDPTGHGLLQEVSRVPTAVAAEVLRSRLARAGIRATVSRSEETGYRILVFPADLVPAKLVVGGDPPDQAPSRRRTS